MRHRSDPRRVALFCLDARGHFQPQRPVIAELTRAGADVFVLTDARFREEVEHIGGHFVDLLGPWPIDTIDDDSFPPMCRAVIHGADHAEEVAALVSELGAQLVLHDTSAVIGAAVASSLGLPRVQVGSGHAVTASSQQPLIEAHPRLHLTERLWQAAETLERRDGLAGASPFSFFTCVSSLLNLYPEPARFLPPSLRPELEPIAFFGSVVEERDRLPSTKEPGWPERVDEEELRVLVSFGTLAWTTRHQLIERLMAALADAFHADGQVQAIFSLGGEEAPIDPDQISRPSNSVVTYCDQWRLLQEADLFVTHCGMNSVHEAIYHGVPMLSYPLIWDHPAMASLCDQLGLAIRLVPGVMAEAGVSDGQAALRRFRAERADLLAALGRARAWEDEVIEQRPLVARRILGLAAS